MLDSRQVAHAQANRARIRQGRLRAVTLIRKSGSETVYAAAACTWQEARGAASGAANRGEEPASKGPDVTAEFPPDVDLSDVVAIVDTPDSTKVASARKYRVREWLRLGLTGAPNRILAKLAAIR